MNNLKELRFVVGHADNGVPKVWIRGEVKTHGKGVNYLSFLLLGDEIHDLMNAEKSDFHDGYHYLKTFGESWTFRELDHIPREDSGVMQVRYLRIKMPVFCRKKIYEDIKQAFETLRDTGGEISLDYSDRLDDWDRYYGVGTGEIRVDTDHDTKIKIEKCKLDDSFKRCWTVVENLAKNTTFSYQDTGIIRISQDGDGFFWSVPGSLHGGIINHGTEDSPDWSVHT